MPRRKGNTAIAKWDEEFARSAHQYADQEANVGGGSFFSIRGGVLKLDDSPLPNNEMAVVIADAIMENTYYEDDFDPDAHSSPTCYAFGRSDDSIQPHKEVEDPQCDKCKSCDNNQWGSAQKGRGKACRNRRRLALIPAGTLKAGTFNPFGDKDEYAKTPLTYLALPPTSLAGFASFVKKTATVLKRPPHGVFTRIALVPDNKTQFKVTFEVLDKIPSSLAPVIIERHKEACESIEFPYQVIEEDKPRRRSKKKSKKKGGRSRARKY